MEDAIEREGRTFRRRVERRVSGAVELDWLFRAQPPAPWMPDYATLSTAGKGRVVRGANRVASRLHPRLWRSVVWPSIRRHVLDYAERDALVRCLHDAEEHPLRDTRTGQGLKVLARVLDEPWPLLPEATFYELFNLLGAMIREVRRSLGLDPDAFVSVKRQQTARCLDVLESARRAVESAPDPLEFSLRLACRANWIDSVEDPGDALGSFLSELKALEGGDPPEWSIRDDAGPYRPGRAAAWLRGDDGMVLYELDNAGEVVFDLLVAEQLIRTGRPVALAARTTPVANDVTLADVEALIREGPFPTLRDALEQGEVSLVSLGAYDAGRLLYEAPPSYQQAFVRAGTLVSKGQANAQTLPMGVRRRRRFLAHPYRPRIVYVLGFKSRFVRLAMGSVLPSPPSLGTAAVIPFDPVADGPDLVA